MLKKAMIFLFSEEDGSTWSLAIKFDRENPIQNPMIDSSLHFNYNKVHDQYNQYIRQKVNEISNLAKENNWKQSEIQNKIRKLQRETKKQLKKGAIKCH